MKILKLSLIFLATLVVVVGALWLTMGGTSGTASPAQNDLYDRLSKEIPAQWQNMTPWSREAYDNTRTDLNQKKDAELLTIDQCSLLEDLLRNNAINRLFLLAKEEFAKPDCQADIVRAFNNEAKRLNAERADKERLQKLCSIYTLYTNIRKFVGSSLTYTPRFDGERWTSLNTHRDNALRQAQAYRSNALYTEYLSHIDGFAEGLTDATVRNKVEKGRARYYAALSNRIIEHFESIKSPTSDDADKLKSIYNAYRREYPQGSSALFSFYRKFQSEAGSEHNAY